MAASHAQEKRRRGVLQRDSFREALLSAHEADEAADGTHFFAVSTAWHQLLVLYFEGEDAIHPGPVDNRDLLSDDRQLLPGLSLRDQYRAVSEPQWRLLADHCGAPPVTIRAPMPDLSLCKDADILVSFRPA